MRSLFFELVKPKICQLLKDLNGTYIVQKFSKFFFNEYGCQINTIIIDNSVELCTYRHGCCVIQKYLENRDPYLLPNLVYKLLDGFFSLNSFKKSVDYRYDLLPCLQESIDTSYKKTILDFREKLLKILTDNVKFLIRNIFYP